VVKENGMRHWTGMAIVLLCCACIAKPIYRSGSQSASVPTATREKAVRSSNPAPRSPVTVPRQTAHPVNTEKIDTSKAYQIGVASYYGEKFHGRKTANGETFNMYKLTAAHRVLPLGTRVRVTHLGNGRWVEVKVNDRGPFIEGRILDLSFAAALELEMVKAGTANIMIELIDPVD
jgi:rare lipoprotein A